MVTPILNFVRWAGLSPLGKLGNKEGKRSQPRIGNLVTEAVSTELFKESQEDLVIATHPQPPAEMCLGKGSTGGHLLDVHLALTQDTHHSQSEAAACVLMATVALFSCTWVPWFLRYP